MKVFPQAAAGVCTNSPMAQIDKSPNAIAPGQHHIGCMQRHTTRLELFEASDAEGSYALKVSGVDGWKARVGLGSQLESVWKIEVETSRPAEGAKVDWEAVLARAIEAREMSDPVLTNYEWPERHNDSVAEP